MILLVLATLCYIIWHKELLNFALLSLQVGLVKVKVKVKVKVMDAITDNHAAHLPTAVSVIKVR